jgi:hypothetical protein
MIFRTFVELLDITRKLVDEIAGEAIGPELIRSLSKRDLELDLLGFMAIATEEVECVFKDPSKWSATVSRQDQENSQEILLEHHCSSNLFHVLICRERLMLLDLP